MKLIQEKNATESRVPFEWKRITDATRLMGNFRLTNISNDVIDLSAGESYAAMFFSLIEGNVDCLYTGAFSDELDFRGMGEYTEQYKKAMHEVRESMFEEKS